MTPLTAHFLVDQAYAGNTGELLHRLREIARTKYGVHHMTLQLDKSLSDCTEDYHLGHLAARARSGG